MSNTQQCEVCGRHLPEERFPLVSHDLETQTRSLSCAQCRGDGKGVGVFDFDLPSDAQVMSRHPEWARSPLKDQD